MQPPLDPSSQMSDLELAELDGSITPDQYVQLMCCYLITADHTNAALLWKRVPEKQKKPTKDKKASVISDVWSFDEMIRNRDLVKMGKLIDERTWPETLSAHIELLMTECRCRALDLIGRSYTSISIDAFTKATGLTVERVPQTVIDRGWQLDDVNKVVIIDNSVPGAPVESSSNQSQQQATANTSNSGDMLAKLIDYTSFLDN